MKLLDAIEAGVQFLVRLLEAILYFGQRRLRVAQGLRELGDGLLQSRIPARMLFTLAERALQDTIDLLQAAFAVGDQRAARLELALEADGAFAQGGFFDTESLE